MTDASGGAREAYPSGWWYALAAAVAVATVVATGVLGFVRATDLMDKVDAFQHLGGSGSTVNVTEPGEYAIYHEWVERDGAGPLGRGTPTAEPAIVVRAPDGSAVPVEPSGITYGWGKEQANAVGRFRATEPGEYRIEASGTQGRLAFGELIPSGPLYGFGPVLVAAAAVIVGSVVGSVVVAQERRAQDSGEARGDGVPRRTWVAVGVGGVMVLAIGIAVALIDGAGDDSTETVKLEGSSSPDDPPMPSTSVECTSDADFESGLCGLTPEELREVNLGYADRLEFEGDLAHAKVIASHAEAALDPLKDTWPYPSPEQVQEALAPLSASVVVSSNAVRTSGTAFGIAVDGGCVFGSVVEGSIEVEVGGYVKDGGCLAEYGH